jgi:UDP-N-acetylmuramoyl-tripeptide--D-alanyl-D-alanine ligase
MKFNTYATKRKSEQPYRRAADDPCRSIPAKHEMAVIEMGANHQQEIALARQYDRPAYARAHYQHRQGASGRFRRCSEGIKKGKGELFDYLSKKKGTVFVNSTRI